MAKIILGKQPKEITKELSFPMLDGTVGHIKVDYVYRTRKQFAEFVDSHMATIKAEAEAAMQAEKAKSEAAKNLAPDAEAVPTINLPVSQVELTGAQMESQIKFIMGAVTGWNLDIPFDREAVEELVDELPQAAAAIIQSYHTAMNEGRLGN